MRILSAVLFLPLLGALVLVLIPRRLTGVLMGTGLVAAATTFALSLPLYFRFDGDVPDYQFEEYASWMPSLGVGYHLGIDGISLLLVLLTTFLTPLALLSAWHAIEDR